MRVTHFSKGELHFLENTASNKHRTQPKDALVLVLLSGVVYVDVECLGPRGSVTRA